jgi:hypothetical protein
MLWVGLLALFSLLFGVWGYLAARSRGRTPIVWALVCAFTFFIGIAIVYSLGDPLYADHAQDRDGARHVDDQADADAADEPTQRRQSQLPAVQAPPPVTVLAAEGADDRRWRYLTEYHPRISEAVRRIEPLGQDAHDELKFAYLALNDATLLPGILRRIDERFGGSQRGFTGLNDFGRPFNGTAASDEDEPIDLQVQGHGQSVGLPAMDGADRGQYAQNGARSARLTPTDLATEAAPQQDYRSLRESTADAEREQGAYRSVFDKDRAQRPDSAGTNGSAANSMVSQAQQAERPAQDWPAERSRQVTALNGGSANGSVTQSADLRAA